MNRPDRDLPSRICIVLLASSLAVACKSTTTAGFAGPNSPSDSQGAECLSTKGPFVNRGFRAQTGKFVAEFDARIYEGAHEDSAVGLASKPADGYGDMGCILYLGRDGTFQVRNSRVLASDVKMAYQPNTVYHVRFAVDVPADRYSVFVTPSGGKEVALATNYAFRQSEKTPDGPNVVREKFTHVRVVAQPGGKRVDMCDFKVKDVN